MFKNIILVILILALLTGCTTTPELNKQPPPTNLIPVNPTPSPGVEDKVPSIGGISLGDSKEKVTNALGSDFEVNYIDEGGYFGEPYDERTYNNGIKLILGKNSGKVLQIMSTAVNMPTEMDAKIGDDSASVLQKYRAKYKEPVSVHGAGKLEGWFEVGDDQLMIFDFDADDETMVNQKIETDSKIEKMILVYSKFMD